MAINRMSQLGLKKITNFDFHSSTLGQSGGLDSFVKVLWKLLTSTTFQEFSINLKLINVFDQFS